jgi:hypothetical protein
MQTFLPNPSYTESARVLDYKRLGKQRVETKQILNAMSKTTGGWRNHPATKMWRGHEVELCLYGAAMCAEWKRRGYRDSLHEYFLLTATEYLADGRKAVPPPWLGDEAIHASHRSNLKRKDPAYYAQYRWDEPDDLPYIWPVE